MTKYYCFFACPQLSQDGKKWVSSVLPEFLHQALGDNIKGQTVGLFVLNWLVSAAQLIWDQFTDVRADAEAGGGGVGLSALFCCLLTQGFLWEPVLTIPRASCPAGNRSTGPLLRMVAALRGRRDVMALPAGDMSPGCKSLHLSALPGVGHPSWAQAWVEVVVKLAKHGAAVAKRWRGRWGGESWHRGQRGGPLWHRGVRGIGTKTCGGGGPRGSIPRQVHWHGTGQGVLSYHQGPRRHPRHLREEAAEARSRPTRGGRRDSFWCAGDVRHSAGVFGAACPATIPWFGAQNPPSRSISSQGVRLSLSLTAEIAVVKHFLTVGIEGPVVALALKKTLKTTNKNLF